MPAAFGGFAGSPPVIDFHTHLQRGIAAGDLIRLMDESGVARLVLMPLYYGDGGGAVNDGEGSDQQALDYARRHPERLVPFCGMQRSELNRPEAWSMSADARRILAETDSKLASGAFFGLGELMLRFYPYTNRFGIRAVSDMDHPVFSPLMRHFADLSAKHRAPMVVHAEAEPHVAAGMRRLLEAHPEAVVVWSHNCGRSSAAAIAEMMARHRNLHADLGGMVYSGPQVEHYGVYYPRRTPWMHLVVDAAGIVADDMKPVFERFADRFVIGTDIAHARVYARYAGHWPRWRSFFGQLSAATAEAIAWRNADRLIRG
ncbi:MAG: hypothetical protein FJX46_10685 [Alphaproteobacteria bacterium]|nr:hypothetical protein [Alphaproteobacteria bacterium]